MEQLLSYGFFGSRGRDVISTGSCIGSLREPSAREGDEGFPQANLEEDSAESVDVVNKVKASSRDVPAVRVAVDVSGK